MELPVEHGLLLDNLLDLAHAPFTHTSTFAKGWTVPRFVLPSKEYYPSLFEYLQKQIQNLPWK